MSTASTTAFLLWAILSVIFLAFLVFHLWSYDRFKCLHWSSGRQPGAFKRVMTYSYLGSVPLFVFYSIAITIIKYREGFVLTPEGKIIPKPLSHYSPQSKGWLLPLNFVFSIAYSLELVTHLEELAFWLYLLHQNPHKEEWFSSWEYRLWYLGSMVSIIGMPLTALITRRNIDTCDAYIFLVGSAGSTTTTICFLYVLWRFPAFIKHVKTEGADPSVVVRLATFYQLNLARVAFRFLFTIPLLVVALDGIIAGPHPIAHNSFWADFLLMLAGIGCFASSAITLLIFFPRSIIKEAGYKPKLATTLPNSPKSNPITPPFTSPRPPHTQVVHQRYSQAQAAQFSPVTTGLQREDANDEWEDQSMSHDDHDLEDEDFSKSNIEQVPPYPQHSKSLPFATNSPRSPIQSADHLNLHAQFQSHLQSQQPSRLHAQQLSQLDPQPVPSRNSLEEDQVHGQSFVVAQEEPIQAQQQLDNEQTIYQRHPFPHSASSPQILTSPPLSPTTPTLLSASQHVRIPMLPQSPRSNRPNHKRRVSMMNSVVTVTPTNVGLGFSGDDCAPRYDDALSVQDGSSNLTRVNTPRIPGLRGSSTLHPYVMTFTSPIDLVDIPLQPQDQFSRTA
ncbi:hypothetical protein C8Q75DRAFT_308037 [Abortiporus biennis]|nr:hypothetical protein C8Q75DRAFT_308037 [Abortiporus biennis]